METLAVAALTAALTIPGSRAQLVALRPSLPPACTATEFDAPRPLAASGEVALRARGRTSSGGRCEGWAWARVRVLAPTTVTTRALADGDPIDPGAIRREEREVTAGREPLRTIPRGATAARAITAGAAIDEGSVRIGPRPGDPITVQVRAGSLWVEQVGRAIACARGRACALLASGRRVEGAFDGERLVVEAR